MAVSTAEQSPVLRPLSGGIVMSGISRIAIAVLGFGTTVAVARILGPAGAGGFAIAQTLMMFMTVAATLGVEHGITYFVGSGQWNARGAYLTVQRVAAATGLVGAGVAIGFRLVAPSAFGGLSLGATAAVAGALPFSLSWLYFTSIAVATDDYEPYVLVPTAQAVLNIALVVVLGLALKLPGAVAGFALAHLATAAGAAVVARRRFTVRDADADADADAGGGEDERGQLRRAVLFGIKGYAANALQLINYRLDLFILSAVSGAAAVGRYSVAVVVTSTLWILPQALSEVLFPRIAALSSRDDEDSGAAREFVEAKSLRHVTAVVIIASGVLAAALVLLVVPIYGPAFRPAIDLGLILLPGVALLGLVNTMAAIVVGRGHPGYLLASALVLTPITVVLYVTLIPSLHASGAALASSISYAGSFVLTAFIYRHVTGQPLLTRLAPTRSEFGDYARVLGGALSRRRASDR
jgi:O-antigen/teichoic acid export membrane protein